MPDTAQAPTGSSGMPPHGGPRACSAHAQSYQRLAYLVGAALIATGLVQAAIWAVVGGSAADPQQAVAELARVTRSGGRVALLEFDLGTVFLDHPDRPTTRQVLDALADDAAQGWMGRQLPRLLTVSGLVEVVARPQVVLTGLEFFQQLLAGPPPSCAPPAPCPPANWTPGGRSLAKRTRPAAFRRRHRLGGRRNQALADLTVRTPISAAMKGEP